MSRHVIEGGVGGKGLKGKRLWESECKCPLCGGLIRPLAVLTEWMYGKGAGWFHWSCRGDMERIRARKEGVEREREKSRKRWEDRKARGVTRTPEWKEQMAINQERMHMARRLGVRTEEL